MTGKTILKGAALVLAAAIALSTCSKTQAQAGAAAAQAIGRPTPATDFSYDLTADGKGVKITDYDGEHARIIVPDTIEGYPVTEIRGGVFRGSNDSWYSLMSFWTPEAASVLGPALASGLGFTYQEYGANNATYIYIPDSVTTIGDEIFQDTPNLLEVRLSDNITVIPKDAFYKSGIRKVNLPKDLQEIKSSAFNYCTDLTELIIPDSIQSVKLYDGAFSSAQKLPLATRAKIQAWHDAGGS